MENASKALIMAASVLIAIMVLSLGVYLFSIFGGTSQEITNVTQKVKFMELIAILQNMMIRLIYEHKR